MTAEARFDAAGRTRAFSGHAKARAELARYEARQHKQTYWLEPTK